MNDIGRPIAPSRRIERRSVLSRLRRGLLATVGVTAVVGSTLIVGAGAATGAPNDFRLYPGEQLGPGQQLNSTDGRFVLVMQRDGNLVQRAPGNRPVWSSNTRRPNSIARMQPDGNLVVIAPGNVPIWATDTGRYPNSVLDIQNDGNVVVYSSGHVARWSSFKHGSQLAPQPGMSGGRRSPATAPGQSYANSPQPGVPRPTNTPQVSPVPADNRVVERNGPCTLFGIGVYDTYVRTPKLEGLGPVERRQVVGSGRITVSNNTACSYAKVQVVVQSNVCGRLGCDWKDQAKSDLRLLPEAGEINVEVRTDCRPGSHHYRARLVVIWTEASVEETPRRRFVPYLETKSKEFDGERVRLVC